MKKSLLLLPFLHGCATMEWSNSYGTDFCAYPSGFIVGIPTAAAASLVAGPAAAIGLGVAAGGTMILNGWTNYGGTDVGECIESYKRVVIEGNESAQPDTSEADR